MKVLNCVQFKEMMASANNNLNNKHEEINTLNVFPVPDGDTGTNMNMTFSSGVNAILNSTNDFVDETSKLLSRNMLMGARGNSGVILSQIFKGFANAVAGKHTVTVEDVCAGFSNGCRVAYKAVMRPVEGTILTVIREASDYAAHYYEINPEVELEDWFNYFVKEAQNSLARTPELLPVLKEVGVVDSGGAGLLAILEGCLAYLQGNPVVLFTEEEKKEAKESYCVEVEIALNEIYDDQFDAKRLTESLGKNNEDVKVLRDGNVVRIHVHTEEPGTILTTCHRFGVYNTVKVENMAISHNMTFDYEPKKPKVKSKYEIIAVCNGDGIEELFRSLRVNYFVKGGQTMNPSTESFVSLIKEIESENIIILPNNGNILLAAQQACDIMTDYNITVLPAKTIPQGIAACLAFNDDEDITANTEAMLEAIKHIKSGSVTNAIKDTTYNGVEIRNGDFMGLSEGSIVISTADLMEASKALLDHMIDDESEFVTIIYGSQASEELANQLAEYVDETYSLDCEVDAGKQDLYPFLIGVE